MIVTVGLLVLGAALTVVAGSVLVAIARLGEILPPLWVRERNDGE
jgi:hypothetical protein